MKSSKSRSSNMDAAGPVMDTLTTFRLPAVIFSLLVYGALFLLLKDTFGYETLALSIFPVGMAGWFFGVTGGLITGILMILFDAFLLWATGADMGSTDLLVKAASGSVFILFTGFTLGRLNYYSAHVRKELARQKLIDQDLNHKTSLLKAALEAGPGGIAVTDLKGTIVSNNQQFRRLWGLTDPDSSQPRLLGRFFVEQVKDSSKFLYVVDAARNEPEQETCYEIELKDGRTFESCCTPHILKNELVGIIWRFNDITDSITNRGAFQTNELKIRGLIDNSLDGITMTDESDRLIEWNPAMALYTGFDRESVVGKCIWDIIYELIPPEEKEVTTLAEIQGQITEAVKDGLNYPFGNVTERAICLANGNRKILETQWFQIRTDKGIQQGSIWRDITQRKAYEKALIENHDLARTILNAYPDIALLVDTQFNILSCNKSFSERVNRPPRKIVNTPLFDYFSREKAARTLKIFSKVIQLKRPATYEDWEPENSFYITVYPIFNDSGTVNQLAYFARDITATSQRERELEAGVVAAGQAHEPLDVLDAAAVQFRAAVAGNGIHLGTVLPK